MRKLIVFANVVHELHDTYSLNKILILYILCNKIVHKVSWLFSFYVEFVFWQRGKKSLEKYLYLLIYLTVLKLLIFVWWFKKK